MEFVLLDAQARALLEEEERLDQRRTNRQRLRSLRDTSDPFSLPEIAFSGMYRLSKDLTRALIEELRPHMAAGVRTTAVPVEIKVLCALHFYGQGSYQKGVGSDAHLGLSQSAVSNAITEVTDALNVPQIFSHHVKFPILNGERRAVVQRNYAKHNIPGVLGFVDGTHIAIKRPDENEELYINRKRFHSLNVQIVSDSDYKILNVVSRFNGSAHDAFIWANSTVREVLERVWQEGERVWLLGDSGYPLEPWLHTPILNAAPGTPEEHYTRMHMVARSSVERAIGHLKNRFRCLMRHRVLHYHPRKAGLIVNACCVLHNMCLDARLPHFEPDEREEDLDEAPVVVENPNNRRRNNEAFQARAAVVRRLQAQ